MLKSIPNVPNAQSVRRCFRLDGLACILSLFPFLGDTPADMLVIDFSMHFNPYRGFIIGTFDSGCCYNPVAIAVINR